MTFSTSLLQINLRNVLEVNEVSQICSLETTIRMYWVDPRVRMVASQEDKQIRAKKDDDEKANNNRPKGPDEPSPNELRKQSSHRGKDAGNVMATTTDDKKATKYWQI